MISARVIQKLALLSLVLQLFIPFYPAFLFRPRFMVALSRSASLRHEQLMAADGCEFMRRWSSRENGIEKEGQNRSIHFLILPGFFNDSQDYTMPGSLMPCLSSRGITPDRIHILPVKRIDWLTVFLRGVLDIKFWRSEMAPTRASFSWYLERISDKVQRIVTDEVSKGRRKEDVKVVLIGHSAGGWLARAAVGFGTMPPIPTSASSTEWGEKIELENIAGLVSLGTPHIPPPEGLMDMTRGALRITNEYFPGAFHSRDGVFYVTVIGNAVPGKEPKSVAPRQPQTVEEYAYVSYEAVCGKGSTIGDGVVPIDAAHLNDAIQVELPDVYHSTNRPEDWYGSDKIIDQWLTVVLEQLKN